MENADKKLGITVAIVIFIIISGIVFFPYPSEAEKMVIKPADINGFEEGLDWDGHISGFMTMPRENVSSGVVFWYNSHPPNETIIVEEELTVFNSKEACTRYFSGYPQNDSMQVGDGSYGWYDNWSYVNFRLALVKENVYIWLDVGYQSYSGNSVHDPKLMAYKLAELQIDKIDNYLAQHPGASR